MFAMSYNGSAVTSGAESAEHWKPVRDCPDYCVSDLGHVRSERRGRPRLIGNIWADGYRRVWLYPSGDGRRERKYYRVVGIHQLVLQTFVGPCPAGCECRHLDGNPLNNRLSNLAWGTRAENAADASRQARLKTPNVSEEMIAAIRVDREAGLTYRRLCEKYGLGVRPVRRALRGRDDD